MTNHEIEVHSDDIKALGSEILEDIFDRFPDPISVKDMLVIIETLNSLSGILKDQLEEEGVKIGYRREEKT